MQFRASGTARVVAVGAALSITLAGCGVGGSVAEPGVSPAPTTLPSSSSAGSVTTSPTATSASSEIEATTPVTCVSKTLSGLSADQRAGQLLMIAVQTTTQSSAKQQIGQYHVGNVIFLGGWRDRAPIKAVATGLQAQAGPNATRNVKLIVAADQEGGAVQQLKGSGFSTMPTALQQGRLSDATLRRSAHTWGSQLRAAGVNTNLAPVSDTVPASLGTRNGPIGRWDRQYSSNPTVVGQKTGAFIHGMRDAGVTTSIKHFPGIGRIIGNTDHTASGIVDTTTTRTDPYLAPFRAGMKAGTGMVMVSTATYTKIDRKHAAAFSRPIVTDLLRGDLGWRGVVITDDVGAAASVQSVPVGQRATRFIDAGGDIVLTADLNTTGTMQRAIVARYRTNATFKKRTNAAVRRVLTLKDQMGLLPCSR